MLTEKFPLGRQYDLAELLESFKDIKKGKTGL